jgi:hypothetical protein
MASTGSTEAWEIRAARHQALFRAVNEELRNVRRASNPSTLTIACECADVDCVETIDVDVGRYAEIRREATYLLVLPGHVYPEVEHVIAEDAHFVVVEKIGEGAQIVAVSNGDHGNA